MTRLVLARRLAGRPLHRVSAYLLAHGTGTVLVDSGPPATARELLGWLRSNGTADDLAAVIVTHHHEDHVGGAALVAEALGVPLWAPAPTVERLARRPRIPLYRRAVWGRPRACAARPLGERFELGGLCLEAIPTPGHAFDHHVLFDRERRWLFSGDLYVHERVRYLRRIEDPWLHVASLRRAAALGPERLYCAHAGVVEGAAAALERKAAWWDELAAEARRLRAGGLGERAITRRLLGREGLFTWLSLGDFSKINLVRALLAGPAGAGSSGVHGGPSGRSVAQAQESAPPRVASRNTPGPVSGAPSSPAAPVSRGRTTGGDGWTPIAPTAPGAAVRRPRRAPGRR